MTFIALPTSSCVSN